METRLKVHKRVLAKKEQDISLLTSSRHSTDQNELTCPLYDRVVNDKEEAKPTRRALLKTDYFSPKHGPDKQNNTFGRDHHIKGGEAIYSSTNLKNEISYLELENHSIPLICEIAAIKLSLTNSIGLCILGVYRPPTTYLHKTRQALGLLAYVLVTLPATNSQTLIVGDINIDDLRSSTEKNFLHELLASFNILRIHLPATMVTLPSATSLGVVCTNLSPDHMKVRVLQTGILDHSGQLCSLYVRTSVNVRGLLEKPLLMGNFVSLDMKVLPRVIHSALRMWPWPVAVDSDLRRLP
ncbi:hypothetical protein J6590_081907 [Homalodisca vitripennis]|nr:hypothetical protein J6590_081907 [Homalodisca vitripennis]